MEFKVNDEKRFKEFTSRLKMKEASSSKRPRIKVYAKFEIEVVPTTDYTDVKQLQKQLRVAKDQEMLYIIVTDQQHIINCSKEQFEFISESLPENWLAMYGKRWQIRQTLKHFNIKWSKF